MIIKILCKFGSYYVKRCQVKIIGLKLCLNLFINRSLSAIKILSKSFKNFLQ